MAPNLASRGVRACAILRRPVGWPGCSPPRMCCTVVSELKLQRSRESVIKIFQNIFYFYIDTLTTMVEGGWEEDASPGWVSTFFAEKKIENGPQPHRQYA